MVRVLKPRLEYELADGQVLKFHGTGSFGIALEGTTNEEVLELLVQRIEDLNASVPCRENSLAITKIEEALHWLQARERRLRPGASPTPTEG